MGAWTFGRLMTEMANEPATGIRPGDFVEQWIQQWTVDLTINSFTVFNRAARAQLFLDNWPRLPDGQLDLAQAPFRLLAIVNRLDLRGSTLYGSSDAGEARPELGQGRPLGSDRRQAKLIAQRLHLVVLQVHAIASISSP